MNVTLIQATPNAIETIAQIASICYDSGPKNPMGLVKHGSRAKCAAIRARNLRTRP